MAKDDIEIEIKIQVTREAFQKVLKILKRKGKFVKKSHQIDEYFTPAHRNFVQPKYPFEWLSIRQRDGKAVLNYKHFHPENAAVQTHCDEFDIFTENFSQLQKLFKALDIRSLVTVEKKREVYTFKTNFEIAMDQVKDLGYYIEIEALHHFGGIEETRQKLFALAKELEIGSFAPDERGYPYILMKKKGLLKI